MNILQNNLVRQLAQHQIDIAGIDNKHIWIGINDKLVEGE